MPPFIEVSGLSKSFGGTRVIEGLDLAVERGEIVVFQGASGVGKSTFLRCLTFLEPFQRGRITVDGLQLTPRMDERRDHETIISLRQKLGFVFQSFNLFPHLSVLENLTLGPVKVLGRDPAAARREALELLARVGLEEKADLYPRALSGGQQQRVGIARALNMKPEAILFDEPTSSLDPAMKKEIVDVMERFAREGLTMLIVTHEPSFMEKIATRVVEFGPQCRVALDKPAR